MSGRYTGAGLPAYRTAPSTAPNDDAPGRAGTEGIKGQSSTNTADCARGGHERKHRQSGDVPFEPTSHAKAQALRQILRDGPGTGATTQMRRLVVAMDQLGEVSRVEAETYLGTGHCCRRIADLTEAGYLIGRRWIAQIDASGCIRRTVAYSILVKPGAPS